jgi:hypothetical protein
MAETTRDDVNAHCTKLQPHQVLPYGAPVPPGLTLIAMPVLEFILAGNLSCRNAVLRKENFLPLPSNSDIPYSIVS